MPMNTHSHSSAATLRFPASRNRGTDSALPNALPGHQVPPPLDLSKGGEETAPRGAPSACLPPARKPKQSAQADSRCSLHLHSLPGGRPGQPGRSGAVLRGEQGRPSGRTWGRRGPDLSSPGGRAGKSLQRTEKVPSLARPAWPWEEARARGASSPLRGTLWSAGGWGGGHGGGGSARTYLELAPRPAPVAFRSAPDPPIPRRSRPPQPHSP